MTKPEADSLLAEFQSSPHMQTQLANWINYFGRICAANALARGFHDDEDFLRTCCEHGLFEAGASYEAGAPAQLWMDEHLAWFDSAVLQAELARQLSEIGEAVEAIRKPGPDSHCPDFTNFLIEEADVMIRVGDTCLKRGLPLGEAAVAKLLYNLSRPFKHGKNS